MSLVKFVKNRVISFVNQLMESKTHNVAESIFLYLSSTIFSIQLTSRLSSITGRKKSLSKN